MTDNTPQWAIKPLSAETWPAFEALAAKHNGVWGGCWCTWFHGNKARLSKEETNHDYKRRLATSGQAHAALVFEGEEAIAWCQFGSPLELPRINSKKAYESLALTPADWRITCFFVDNSYRRQGVATAALNGALGMIAALGGGVVEAFPWNWENKRTSANMLFVGRLDMFTEVGFEVVAPLGVNLVLVRRTLAPAREAA